MNRDLRIDFLRFLGLSLVILAHIQAPYTLTQIRSFDVPLMVFVSGLTASGKEIPCYWQYVRKRTKRLIIPVWFFLAVYLSAFYFLQFYILPEQYLTGRMIVRSFLLLDESIGYVWIIRVFMLVMLVTPIVVKVTGKIRNEALYIIIVILMVLLNQVAFQLSTIMEEGTLRNAFVDVVVYGIAYSIPFAIGVRLKESNRKTFVIYVAILLCLFSLLSVNCVLTGNNPIGVSSGYKFPPRPYFIVYGSLISVILWATKKWWGKLSKNKFTTFIGQNTIWIYLWHMPFALFATVFMHNWAVKYFFVYGMALALFWIQYRIVKKIDNRIFNKYLLG